MNRHLLNAWLLLSLASTILCCLDQQIDCPGAEEQVLTGLSSARGEFGEIAHLLDKAQVLCLDIETGAWSCGFTKTPKALEGCTPFSGRAAGQRGRIVVIDGADTCRVVVHEAVHWLDMGMDHKDAKWPTEREQRAKAGCSSVP